MSFVRPRMKSFLAIPYSLEFRELREAVEKSAREARYSIVALDKAPARGSTIQEAILGELARADCVIADLTYRNPNVFFELGLAQAMGKALFLLVRQDEMLNVPVDLKGYQFIIYEPTLSGYSKLTKELSQALKDYRKSPRPAKPYTGTRFVAPFFIDWDRLSPTDVDNLVRELLSQLGYRKIEWDTNLREVDLVAELPKRDPDGFEYRELWFISMGHHAPPEMLLDMASMDPDHLMFRLVRDSYQRERVEARLSEIPATLLIIFTSGEQHVEDYEKMRLYSSRKSRGNNLRIRIWDRNYLTSLIQQFPLIGYKYFSSEARSRSESRKTYEELYEETTTLFQETVRLNNRLSSTVAALEEEKNKRVRAERDAVWKDISFSAAHKIGNPIFAIETNLGPLKKRISNSSTEEALEVVESIGASVEKAKDIVEQFKSLTKAQEIVPELFQLRPVLENCSETLSHHGVECVIECPPDLKVYGDPNRLSECFDELSRNATHWFDKTNKLVQIQVTQPAPTPLPQAVDSNQQYTLIRFSDNGKGVSLDDKDRIFDAFFTKRNHGTGLGLALVRRIIEGHGGSIFEVGVPEQGADFEIYLPIVTQAEKPELNLQA